MRAALGVIATFVSLQSTLILWVLALICTLSTFLSIAFGLNAFFCSQRRAHRSMRVTLSNLLKMPLRERVERWVRTLESHARLPGVKRIVASVHRRQKRHDHAEIVRELPHMIDVITLSVAAGLSFDQSLSSYVEINESILARSFGLALRYWQTGLKLRGEALDDVVSDLESTEVARFVSAIQQSLVLGTALVYVLEAQGTEARDAHRQFLETRIAKIPVKMLLPMASCIIPSLLLLLLGPVVIDVMQGLGSSL